MPNTLEDMVRTAINLYSVRELDETIDTVIQRVADAGYDGIQFSGKFTPTNGNPEAIASKLDETGLDVTPAHIGFDALEGDRKEAVDAYETVGVDAAVIPGSSPDNFESAAAVDELANRVNDIADELAEVGWSLHYHNHSFEYIDLDGEWAFDRFINATDVGIELDVGWALVGGDDPATRIQSLDNRAKLIHMKDMDTSVEHGFVDIGYGDVDIDACAQAAKAAGSEWLIYENDDPSDPAATIEHGADILNSLIAG